ncbi:hypothetical protein HMPREF1985_00266 [Mitsuokella sp. oral taxon 131 str. W9106]|nr:hypothetical protein HMPREF1985_00266 [Mitsuokella sp. oral taxon 131 str. W9106]
MKKAENLFKMRTAMRTRGARNTKSVSVIGFTAMQAAVLFVYK